MAQATLIKDGNKVAVESGSPQAQQYFGQGYTLMTPNAPAAPAAPNIPAGNVAVPGGKTSEYTINGQFGQTGQPGSGLYGVPKTTNLTVDKSLLNKPVPTSVNNSAAPSVNDLPKIYRIGADIYDANTNQKLGATQFAKDYSGKAMEVAAPAAPAAPEAPKVAEAPAEKPLTAAQRISTFYNDYTTGMTTAKSKATVDSGLNEKNTLLAQSQTDLNDARTAMQNANILDQKALDAIEGQGRGITTAIIGGQQERLSRSQKLDFALLQNDYNNKLVASQIAQGAYDRAAETVKNTADDFYRNATMQLSILREQNGIEEKAADRLEKELTYERDLAKEGYVSINNPADLAKFKESEIFRDPASGKVYIKPKPSIKSTITANGHVYGIDEKGNVLKDFGTSEKNKSRFTQTGVDAEGYPTYGFVDEETNTIIPAQGNPNGNTSGDPSSTTGDIGSFMTAISGKESGGNYDAKNGRTGASGRFQILPSNWPSWSQAYARDVLGKSIGNMPMTPENQDAVAQYKMQEYYNKYGNWADVASMWYSGRPLSQVKSEGWADKKQGAGNEPSVNEYVNDIMGRMSKSNTSTSSMTSDGYDISKFTQRFYNSPAGQKALNNEQQYLTNFLAQPLVKTFVENQTKAGSIEAIVNSGIGGPEDLALVFEFMKSLDPTSVVRESEYDVAAKSGNPFKQVAMRMGGYVSKGQFLPEDVKQSFVKLSQLKLNEQRKIYDQLRNDTRKRAYSQGLNPDNAAPDLVVNNSPSNAIDFTQFYK